MVIIPQRFRNFQMGSQRYKRWGFQQTLLQMLSLCLKTILRKHWHICSMVLPESAFRILILRFPLTLSLLDHELLDLCSLAQIPWNRFKPHLENFRYHGMQILTSSSSLCLKSSARFPRRFMLFFS